MLIGFEEYRKQARALAAEAGMGYADAAIHHFPDEESLVRLPAELPQEVVLCRSLDRPNTKLIELVLAAAEARELGARRLTLVAPYLCYMRQDRAFHSGEAVSQKVIGRLLAEHFDTVVTVDPHLHRIRHLSEAVPARRAAALTAMGPIADFLKGHVRHALLVGPDGESEQWVAEVARRAGMDYVVGEKVRLGDREVEIHLNGDFADREVVLIDDVASTGRTLEVAANIALAGGAVSVSVMVTHALFVEGAVARLEKAGVGHIWSTDSIPHETNAIGLAPLLAGALGETEEDEHAAVEDSNQS